MFQPSLETTTATNAEELVDCVIEIANGSHEALGRLFDLYADRVHSVAQRIVRQTEDAEEIVSDVFLQVWREAKRFDVARGSVEGWLMRLTHSRAIDRLRRRQARPDQNTRLHPDDLSGAYLQTEDVSSRLVELYEAGSAMHAALARLSPGQRKLISLAFVEGLSHQEIVARTGLPLGTVKSHVRRGLQALRKKMEEAGYGQD